MGDARLVQGVDGPSMADPTADVWIFVDGELKNKREKLRPRDGVFRIDVALPPDARFLTLVSTDGGVGNTPYPYTGDWVVVGDPVLQIVVPELEKK